LGKTKAINERYVYAYLPSVETANDWKARAKKSNISVSQFIFEHVTNSLRQEHGEESYKPRAELIDELRKKDEAIEKLTRDNEITRLALERVENELRRYRAEPFLDDNFYGTRQYDKRLIGILKKGEAVDSGRLLHLLRINPKEANLVKAVGRQLENLQAYGLVQKTHHGWRWVTK
jgi:hypothetical protein